VAGVRFASSVSESFTAPARKKGGHMQEKFVDKMASCKSLRYTLRQKSVAVIELKHR
jgi:hypothetical protein